jgi:uncharacterized repeat protein (TIGR03837 family)
MQADVFCRVVDNFGDIGVTWRLVRQLQREHDWSLRLWVDDLTSFKRLETRIDLHALQQVVEHIEIIHWDNPAPDLSPYPLVLCSFSCDLPETYIAQLHQRPALWLNIEYLSAETWVEGCHGLPSLRGDGLSSYFFFPGFNGKTGGLLREQELLACRDEWQLDLECQRRLLKRLGVSCVALAAWLHQPTAARLLTLFCYPHAPVAQLLEALCAESRPSIVLIPDGVAPELATGRLGRSLQVYIERIPFVSQPEYDQLLWMADLNVVRGEDSIVRALWAGKPLIWQIYPQTEDTHLVKLEAWLEMAALPQEIGALLRTWNADTFETSNLTQQLRHALSQDAYAQWSRHALALSHAQAQETDFAQALVDFCALKAAP